MTLGKKSSALERPSNYAPRIVTRGNGNKYVHWKDANGDLNRKSCDTKDDRVARQRMAEIVAGSFAAPTPSEKAEAQRAASREVTAENVTMAHLFDACRRDRWAKEAVRSQATVASNIRILNRIIGHERVADMTTDRLKRLVVDLRAQEYAPSTISRKIHTVGSALRDALEIRDRQGRPWLSGMPKVPSVKWDKARTRYLSDDELATIWRVISEREISEPHRDWKRYGYLVRWLLDLGCRKGDMVAGKAATGEKTGVTVSAISERRVKGVMRTFVTLAAGKSKIGARKTRELPLSDEIVATLDYLKLAAVDGYLFPIKPAAVNYYWKNVRQDAKKLGANIDDAVVHTLRHTCASQKAKRLGSKGDIFKISKWLGHANVDITTEYYAHLMSDDMVDLL